MPGKCSDGKDPGAMFRLGDVDEIYLIAYRVKGSLEPVVCHPHKRSAARQCLFCRLSPKDKDYDFCGPTCRDFARLAAPGVLEVPHIHTTFQNGELTCQVIYHHN